MKNLYQSLLDYEMALLKAIAECRALSLNTANKTEAVKVISEALLSPADTAIALADLTEPEMEGLRFLLDRDGQVEGPRFAREYGLIRPMGPARLDREKPWRDPVTPAEGLWYRGFIFKGFQVTDKGNLEMVYIPPDLLSLLQMSSLKTEQDNIDSHPPNSGEKEAGTLEVAQMSPPACIITSNDRLRQNIFNLLVYLQTVPVRLNRKAQPDDEAQEQLTNCLLLPLLPTLTSEAELEFLLHLGQRTGLLVTRHSRLKPAPGPTRTWLQASPAHQIRNLQNAWRADPTWNDLWRVPGLLPQSTGWENSPLLARSKILDYLTRLNPLQGAWYSLEDFVAAIKRTEPDFQRPDGNYENWYIQDTAGNYLMGFANWDKVDGALIRYIVTHVLLLLGAVEVGYATDKIETAWPTGFRITPAGDAFLLASPIPSSDKPPGFIRVNANFLAHVSDEVSLYDRFQLARFAELDQPQTDRVAYRITRSSVSRAVRNGVTADQMTAFLARATNNQTPLKVVETLRTWAERQDSVCLEQATLLRVRNEELMTELRQHPALGPLLGETMDTTVVLVAAEHVAEVRRLLTELGYLTDK